MRACAQLSSRTLEADLRWAYELGLDTLLPYLKARIHRRPLLVKLDQWYVTGI